MLVFVVRYCLGGGSHPTERFPSVNSVRPGGAGTAHAVGLQPQPGCGANRYRLPVLVPLHQVSVRLHHMDPNGGLTRRSGLYVKHLRWRGHRSWIASIAGTDDMIRDIITSSSSSVLNFNTEDDEEAEGNTELYTQTRPRNIFYLLSPILQLLIMQFTPFLNVHLFGGEPAAPSSASLCVGTFADTAGVRSACPSCQKQTATFGENRPAWKVQTLLSCKQNRPTLEWRLTMRSLWVKNRPSVFTLTCSSQHHRPITHVWILNGLTEWSTASIAVWQAVYTCQDRWG